MRWEQSHAPVALSPEKRLDSRQAPFRVNWKVGNVGKVYDVDGWDGDNELSSIANKSGKTLRLYKTDNATGFSWCVGPGQDIKKKAASGGLPEAAFMSTRPSTH